MAHWRWRVHVGDCLVVPAAAVDPPADLVYMDPPFNTRRTRSDRSGKYPDVWPSTTQYLDYLRPRVERAIKSLHCDGSILIHCDWRTSHRIRVMLDELLGESAFVNHLIWRYGLGGSSPRRFARKHDDILFYARSPRYYFDPPRVSATSRRMRGMTKKATDVIDIPAINNLAPERTGYPTQKPLALMRLLVKACAPEGGLVLDPFCGSGTTLVAALQTGRRALGIDINPAAVKITRARCRAVGAGASAAARGEG